MIPAPNPDDAFAFLVERLREAPERFQNQAGTAMYDIWMPHVIQNYLQAKGLKLSSGDFKFDPQLEGVSRAFYDAAWWLCRMGVLRPTVTWTAFTGIGQPAAGDGYSFTSSGRAWVTSSELTYIPADPSRYVSLLSKEISRLGLGFAQRAREAAACHQAGNYIAGCAMCGAAAESALLAVAIAKVGDEAKVLKQYARTNGRLALIKTVFGKKPDNLQQRFMQSAVHLLLYWRDESAHGRTSGISELETYHALTLLLRLAGYFFDEWNRLTK
ncbi:hypothetical protein [Candidatus Binatus sp.]|uniref:hypothetical protein n=1 Tax=Candidatus Binatus sp. TaxID=2811406 RepID=UPI003C6F526A